MTLRPDTQPLWQQIYDALSQDIGQGRFARGSKLPTEAELARRFAVNRHTVRRALAQLRGEGVVHARRGAGVFVTNGVVPYRLGPQTRFTQNLKAGGHAGSRQILRLEQVTAADDEASMLKLKPGAPVILLETVATIDAAPALHGRSIFPAAGFGAFADAMHRSLSITAALSACGVDHYRRAWTRLGATAASAMIARHLQIAVGAPLIRSVSVNVDDDDRPVEYARTYFCAERVEILVEG